MTHDAEDIIYPDSLRWVNYFVENYDMVQVPVLALPTPMRAPVEGPGGWALESAMDELAIALGIDPLDLRLENFAEAEPFDGRPWSSNKLRARAKVGYGRAESPWARAQSGAMRVSPSVMR